MSGYRKCRFCRGIFIPSTDSSKFCSSGCASAYVKFEAIRQRQRKAEEIAAVKVEERRKNGLVMNICLGCCSVFYAVGNHEFCSSACERLYNPEPQEGQKSARQAVSLHTLTERAEKERAASNRIVARNRGIA